MAGLLDVYPNHGFNDPHASRILQYCRQYLVYHFIMARTTFDIDSMVPNWRSILDKHLDVESMASNTPIDTRPTFLKEAHMTNEKSVDMDESDTGPSHNTTTHSGAMDMGDTFQGAFRGDIDCIDVCQGFSNSLLLLINEICNLPDSGHYSKEAGWIPGFDHIPSTVQRINTRLEGLVQIPPSFDDQDHSIFTHGSSLTCNTTMFQRRLKVIKATAEANRLATLVFLDQTCRIHIPEVVPDCRSSLEDYISRIFKLVEEICENEPVTAALPIWPVFITGCSLVEDEGRIRVLNILDKFKWQQLFGVSPLFLACLKIQVCELMHILIRVFPRLAR